MIKLCIFWVDVGKWRTCRIQNIRETPPEEPNQSRSLYEPYVPNSFQTLSVVTLHITEPLHDETVAISSGDRYPSGVGFG